MPKGHLIANYNYLVVQLLWRQKVLVFYIQLSDHVRLLLLLLVSRVRLSVTPWTVAHQASLSFTVSPSLLKFMSIELVLPSNHLILYFPLFLLASIFPSTRVFSNESTLRMKWPKHWSFSFSITPSNEHPGLISFSMD